MGHRLVNKKIRFFPKKVLGKARKLFDKKQVKPAGLITHTIIYPKRGSAINSVDPYFAMFIEPISYIFNVRPIWVSKLVKTPGGLFIRNGVKLVGYENKVRECRSLLNYLINGFEDYKTYLYKNHQKKIKKGKKGVYIGKPLAISRAKQRMQLIILRDLLIEKLAEAKIKRNFDPVDENILFNHNLNFKRYKVKTPSIRQAISKKCTFKLNSIINGNAGLYKRKVRKSQTKTR